MDSNRALVVDCQVLQTDAWERGMGKYSLSLLGALRKHKKLPTNTKLLLNSLLPVSESMLGELTEACPDAEVVYLKLQVPSGNSKIVTRTNNKKIIGSYIESLNLLETVDFLILSLFLNQAFIVFPENARKLLIFYDLIPFLFEKRYAERINYSDYLNHFKTIFEADLILTISQTVADDMKVYLGINGKKLTNINGAPIDRSHLPYKKPDFETPNKYIFMPSGDELRKNNHNAVKGFAVFNEQHDNQYHLVITSNFTDDSKRELRIYSDHIVFTGNVLEAELQWLYENSELVLFPSEYEGLGLPILEAMSTNKKISCSNIPVFKEISEDAFYYFDPTDSVSISKAIDDALKGDEWKDKQSKYKDTLLRYSWQNTAEDFGIAYDNLTSTELPVEPIHKPKIAVFTPHPEGYSAIGKVVAETHSSLSELFDVDYYYDYQPDTHSHVRPDYLSHIATCFDAKHFSATDYKKYEAVIYHIGNSDYHLETIKNALYLPGYVVLHDTHLQGAFKELNRLGYITKERLELEVLLNEKLHSNESSFLTSLLNNQLAVITHSEFASRAISDSLPKDIKNQPVNLPVGTPDLIHVPLSDKKIEVGLAGILADVKGLPLIEKLANDPILRSCQFTVFGFTFIKPDILDRLSGFSNVSIYKDPSDFEFQTYLSKLDVLINYRLEYRGETSLTVLESMRYGVVPLVRDVGWYHELPTGGVQKAKNELEVTDILHKVTTDRESRLKSRDQVWNYVRENFTHQEYVSKLLEIIEGIVTPSFNSYNKSKMDRLKESNKLSSAEQSISSIS